MPVDTFNGTPLHYEMAGAGPPLVLVHGGFVEGATWRFVAPAFSRSFQVVTYDRRGHGASAAPPDEGTVEDDVADLAALISTLQLGPANVVGSSFGTCIAFRLAIRRPDLVLRVAGHEPPLLTLLRDDPTTAGIYADASAMFRGVATQLESRQWSQVAETFVDAVLGPGMWQQLPTAGQEMFVRNAPTALADFKDDELFDIDVIALASVPVPLLLTTGARSVDPMYAAVVGRVLDAVPHIATHTFPQAGHVPHFTHPEEYVAVLTRWLTS